MDNNAVALITHDIANKKTDKNWTIKYDTITVGVAIVAKIHQWLQNKCQRQGVKTIIRELNI
jgi:hypothetical protein